MNYVYLAIIGIFCGYLINFLADVLPLTRKISHPACPQCGENFSISEFLTFKKCGACGKSRTTRPIIVLSLDLILSVLLYMFPLAHLDFWVSIPILIFLGTILVIDFEHRLVLYQTSLFGFVFFLVYGIALHGIATTLLGGLAGLTTMLGFYFLGNGFTKIMSKFKKREIDEVAFGFGDVVLGTILGFLTGYPGIIGAIIITMATFVAFSFVYVIILVILGKYRAFTNTLPFTFFLVIGAITIFYL